MCQPTSRQMTQDLYDNMKDKSCVMYKVININNSPVSGFADGYRYQVGKNYAKTAHNQITKRRSILKLKKNVTYFEGAGIYCFRTKKEAENYHYPGYEKIIEVHVHRKHLLAANKEVAIFSEVEVRKL